jgi:DNA topoisomerase-1
MAGAARASDAAPRKPHRVGRRTPDNFRKLARRAGLIHVSDQQDGISRRPSGNGFTYVSRGRTIRNPQTRARIKALAIPPAWREVWICRNPRGHLQATGRDELGRKQYVYHPHWCRWREQVKCDHLSDVAKWLPAIRLRVARDLRRFSLRKAQVAALAVALLDRTAIRVGSAEYARDNQSYGLTTLQNRHAAVTGERVVFEFHGKSGKRHRLEVVDRKLARLVRRCRELPGTMLFQYRDAGRLRPLSAADVNEYLAGITEGCVTSKDFRTWQASVATASLLAANPAKANRRSRERALAEALRRTSELLGNTVAVCRKHYVHTGLMTAWIDGAVPRELRRFRAGRLKWYRPSEQLTLHLLNRL